MNWLLEVTSQSAILKWGLVTVACALLSALLHGFQRMLLSRLQTVRQQTRTPLDDLVYYALERTKGFLIFFLILPACVLVMETTVTTHHFALVLARVAFISQFFLWVDGALRFWIESRIHKKGQVRAGALDLLRVILRILLFALGVILSLDVFGVNVTALVAGLGIGGVAVALALQNILSDLFASLSIILDRPFEVGDFIAAGNDSGTVERIGLKTTRVRTLSGDQMVFPNANLLQSRIRNFRRMRERRVAFTLTVDYSLTAEALKKIPSLLEANVKGLPNTRFERCTLTGLVEAGYQFETVYWIDTASYSRFTELQHRLYLSIVEVLGAHQVPLGPTNPGRQLKTLNLSP